jgi:hypothetical protein
VVSSLLLIPSSVRDVLNTNTKASPQISEPICRRRLQRSRAGRLIHHVFFLSLPSLFECKAAYSRFALERAQAISFRQNDVRIVVVVIVIVLH